MWDDNEDDKFNHKAYPESPIEKNSLVHIKWFPCFNLQEYFFCSGNNENRKTSSVPIYFFESIENTSSTNAPKIYYI